MNKDNEFFNRIKSVEDPEIRKGIESGEPYEICDLLEKTKGGPNGIYLKDLENAIMNTDDIVQIYEFLFLAVDMNIRGFDRERFERKIRESENPKLMCYSMAFVPVTNINLMLISLEKTQNAKYMEMLIKNEEYAEVLEEVKKINPKYEETVEVAKKADYYPQSLSDFRDLKDDIPNLKSKIIDTKNPHLITELANYIEYLNEYKGQAYDIDDLTFAQEEAQDPMQAYEYLASVNVENKRGLINTVINSGKVKFMYYIYEYVLGLTDEEKKQLKGKIMERDFEGKYRHRLEDIVEGDEIDFN